MHIDKLSLKIWSTIYCSNIVEEVEVGTIYPGEIRRSKSIPNSAKIKLGATDESEKRHDCLKKTRLHNVHKSHTETVAQGFWMCCEDGYQKRRCSPREEEYYGRLQILVAKHCQCEGHEAGIPSKTASLSVSYCKRKAQQFCQFWDLQLEAHQSLCFDDRDSIWVLCMLKWIYTRIR